jgi:hypothetical protein
VVAQPHTVDATLKAYRDEGRRLATAQTPNRASAGSIPLLYTASNGTITQTIDGERFVRDARPVLESLARSRS